MSYFMILIATLLFTPIIIIMSSNIIIIPPFNFLMIHGALTAFVIGLLNIFQFKGENVINYFGNKYIIVEEEGVSNTAPNKVAWYFNNILSINKSYNKIFYIAHAIIFLFIYLIVVFVYTLFSSTSIFVYIFIIDIFYHLFFFLRGISNFYLRMDELKQIGKEIFEH